MKISKWSKESLNRSKLKQEKVKHQSGVLVLIKIHLCKFQIRHSNNHYKFKISYNQSQIKSLNHILNQQRLRHLRVKNPLESHSPVEKKTVQWPGTVRDFSFNPGWRIFLLTIGPWSDFVRQTRWHPPGSNRSSVVGTTLFVGAARYGRRLELKGSMTREFGNARPTWVS